jgi:hypothetical protein
MAWTEDSTPEITEFATTILQSAGKWRILVAHGYATYIHPIGQAKGMGYD